MKEYSFKYDDIVMDNNADNVTLKNSEEMSDEETVDKKASSDNQSDVSRDLISEEISLVRDKSHVESHNFINDLADVSDLTNENDIVE